INPGAFKTTTNVLALGLTWQLGMSTKQRSSAVANRLMEVLLLIAWWNRLWRSSLIAPHIAFFGLSIIVRLIVDSEPLTVCVVVGPISFSSILLSMPVGLTRSKSTSPSFKERCLRQTTFNRWQRSK